MSEQVEKMDERTLTALKGSIAKWEGIVAETEVDNGWKNCALCQLFIDNYEEDEDGNKTGCAGCPVKKASGEEGCNNTPYTAWANSHGQWCGQSEMKNEIEIHHRLAEAELAFLKSLLPKGS